MKLFIKKQYFDKILSGEKEWEFRDAHITFICEETGDQLTRKVELVNLVSIDKMKYPIGMFTDEFQIAFKLKEVQNEF